jgi:hypothetical protein
MLYCTRLLDSGRNLNPKRFWSVGHRMVALWQLGSPELVTPI